ncbi:ribonuclease H2, subunit B [Zychaea mexicana]|uniref:ribonuclease H2, subunit B n=1 Tax=Zychaea mexicana TaxID=64656 RepID=UPI0022FDB6FC|nr:ribonuclease H2, subunit B [Zychaea mexicana]KAI9493080.1 ribonuclease H2, subunit B [Zychaea mexicana]
MANNTKFVAVTHAKHHDLQALTPVHLPCPQTGRSALYFHDDDDQSIYEAQKVTGVGRKTSWLIDEMLYKDGSIRHITHVDPLFITLPILENARKQSGDKFRTLDDIFSSGSNNNNNNDNDDSDNDNENNSITYLLRLKGLQQQLLHLCDTKEIATDMHVYRLNDEKALAWLQKKVDQLVPKFASIPLLQSTIAEELEKAATDKENQDIYRQEAVYLLSKYLSESWFKSLLKHLE